MTLGRFGSSATTCAGMPSASKIFFRYSAAGCSFPGGSAVSMRTSAWKCRSVSSSIFVAAVGPGVWEMVVVTVKRTTSVTVRMREIVASDVLQRLAKARRYMFWGARLQRDCRALRGK